MSLRAQHFKVRNRGLFTLRETQVPGVSGMRTKQLNSANTTLVEITETGIADNDSTTLNALKASLRDPSSVATIDTNEGSYQNMMKYDLSLEQQGAKNGLTKPESGEIVTGIAYTVIWRQLAPNS